LECTSRVTKPGLFRGTPKCAPIQTRAPMRSLITSSTLGKRACKVKIQILPTSSRSTTSSSLPRRMANRNKRPTRTLETPPCRVTRCPLQETRFQFKPNLLQPSPLTPQPLQAQRKTRSANTSQTCQAKQPTPRNPIKSPSKETTPKMRPR